MKYFGYRLSLMALCMTLSSSGNITFELSVGGVTSSSIYVGPPYSVNILLM